MPTAGPAPTPRISIRSHIRPRNPVPQRALTPGEEERGSSLTSGPNHSRNLNNLRKYCFPVIAQDKVRWLKLDN